MGIIAKRELDERLNVLYRSGKKVYSFSKASTIHDCLYSAYLTYIKNCKGTSNCYSIMGTKVHDMLQAIMDGKATEKELLPALNSELDDLKMLNINFPKDRNGGDSIREKWIVDMTNFCNTFKKPEGKFETEQLVIYPLSDERYIQGYVDLIQYHSDNEISIYDWKTSSQFSTKDLKEHGRQLVLYAMAKENEGYKVRNIAWVMLKYVTVKFIGKTRKNSKKETEQIKVIERCKVVDELSSMIYDKMLSLGYDEVDAECYLFQAKKNKTLDSLPEDIKKQFIISPYIRYYNYTPELKQDAIDYMNQQADIFENLNKTNETEWRHKSFTKSLKSGKEVDDTFFCNNLCNFKNSCKYLKTYNDLKSIDDMNGANLF